MKIEKHIEIKFPISSEKDFILTCALGVFTPNTTTTLLIHAVKKTITTPVKLLDLGCGTGVVSIALHHYGLISEPLYASDLSQTAVKCSRVNFERYACPAVIRSGTLFQPWPDEKFDVIVDDISGIAEDVASVSPWFQGVPCDTGKDGIDLVTEILRNAPMHLNAGGSLFFPVLSLSNVDILLRVAKENFRTVALVGRQEWPLPHDLKVHMPLLLKLAEEGSIKLEEKFGMVLCYTEVYCASNPII